MGRGLDLERREVWRRRLREFERGSVTVAVFCQRIGVSVATFYQWRRKLAASSERIIGAESPPQAARTRLAATPMNFLPVEIVEQARGTIEVLLPNGARVLVSSSDRAAIRAVVEAAASIPVEERSC